MKKNQISIATATAILVFIIAGCRKEKTEEIAENPITTTTQSVGGKFGIAYIDGLNKRPETGDTVTFNLGDLKASKAFYYLLSNNGDKDIHDIKIKSDNSKIAISPNQIERLSPQSIASVLPIMQLTANHGIALNGFGYTSLMNMGTNTNFVTVSGLTTNSQNDTIPVNMACKFVLETKVVDAEIGVTGGPDSILDLSTPYSIDSYYGNNYYRTGQKIASIKNTGNMPFNAKLFYYNRYNSNSPQNSAFDTTMTIAPGAIRSISSGGFNMVGIILDGANTIADPNKFKIYNDGTVRLMLNWTP